MKKIIFLFTAFILVSSINISAQSKTYDVNGTTYINGEYYKTTGVPKVERNSSAKNKFLKSRGYEKVPVGYQVDHIIPLSQGGTDTPDNMQLISIDQHKQKTANERKSTTSNSYPSYKTTSTGNYSKNTGTTSSSGRIIYTGPKGGRYYYNSSGKKVYLKK